MRVFAGLSASTFTDPTLLTSTDIRAVHITELRSALNAARGALAMAAISFTDPSIGGTTSVRAAHVHELRGGTRQASTTGALSNAAPLFTSASAVAVAENGVGVTTVTTIDAESNPRTYSIFGGADGTAFAIGAASGALTFLSGRDFESPSDSGANNVYDVIVAANDGQGNLAAMAIAVTVTDVDETTFTSPSAVATPELSDEVFHTVTATAAGPVTFAITGGSDQDDLSITSAGALSFDVVPDFFAPHDSDGDNVYVVDVTATGPETAVVQTLSVTVTQLPCVSLPLGGVFTSATPVPRTFCLDGGAEYTVIPVNTSTAPLNISITAMGIVPVTPPPSPLRSTAALDASPMLVEDRSFETRLRERERLEAKARLARRSERGPRVRSHAITPGTPAVGDLMDLNVETDNSCSTSDMRQGRVEIVGEHIIILQEVSGGAAVIANGLTLADYQAIATDFDQTIWPAITGAFGEPADIDGNGRVIAFYTSAVNQLTPPLSGSFVSGFFFSRDLYGSGSCATSNAGELMYMLMADPAGTVNGNARSVSFVNEKTRSTLAHELEHLVNASRRLHVNTPFAALEEVWLDEGLAHVAEELVFYASTGIAPGANVDIATLMANPAGVDMFFRYQESNFGRLREWLLGPELSGPFLPGGGLAARGSAWAALRHTADRFEGSQSALWFGLANTQETGLTNLQSNVGAAPAARFADFAAAMYGDDATAGVVPPFTQPSWNFRDLYQGLDYDPGPACSCAYELGVWSPADGVTSTFDLSPGGAAAYFPMGVPGSRAVVKVRGAGDASLSSDGQLRIFRRK